MLLWFPVVDTQILELYQYRGWDVTLIHLWEMVTGIRTGGASLGGATDPSDRAVRAIPYQPHAAVASFTSYRSVSQSGPQQHNPISSNATRIKGHQIQMCRQAGASTHAGLHGRRTERETQQQKIAVKCVPSRTTHSFCVFLSRENRNLFSSATAAC